MNPIFTRISQLKWQKLDRASMLMFAVLVLCLCWKLATLFWWVVAPAQPLSFERVELGAKQPQIPNITSFALFDEPKAALVNDQINFELQGVVIAYPNRLSSAVIKGSNLAQTYRVGDKIDNSGYQLSEVYWDHVVLRQDNGAVREVRFKGLNQGLYQPPTPAAQAPVTAPSGTTNEIGQAIQSMQQNRDQYLQNMGITTTNGSGYEVTERTPSALRNSLGLSPGDRILSVNGQPVGQGQNDIQLLEQVKREGQVKIEIKRGNQVTTIQQSF